MEYPGFDNINDVIPADFKPNCFDCPSFVGCMVPTKVILMFSEILQKVPETAKEIDSNEVLSIDDCAEIAINLIETILGAHAETEHDKNTTLKVVNTLRALEHLSQEKRHDGR